VGEPKVPNKVRSMVDGGIGAAWTIVAIEEDATVAAKEAIEERGKILKKWLQSR